jgi:hypothetical protein
MNWLGDMKTDMKHRTLNNETVADSILVIVGIVLSIILIWVIMTYSTLRV